jgi:hypothetical protein
MKLLLNAGEHECVILRHVEQCSMGDYRRCEYEGLSRPFVATLAWMMSWNFLVNDIWRSKEASLKLIASIHEPPKALYIGKYISFRL